MSSVKCLEAFLCIVFRRGFLLEWQPCTPVWCRVRRMVWALTGWPSTSSISAAMLKGLLRRDPLCVDPAVFKRLMILDTVLQLSYRVLTIFLLPCLSLCSATIRLLRSSKSSLPYGTMLELSVTSMRECESCTTNLNTPGPYAHGPSNTWA